RANPGLQEPEQRHGPGEREHMRPREPVERPGKRCGDCGEEAEQWVDTEAPEKQGQEKVSLGNHQTCERDDSGEAARPVGERKQDLAQPLIGNEWLTGHRPGKQILIEKAAALEYRFADPEVPAEVAVRIDRLPSAN